MWRPSSCKLDFMTVMFVIILNSQLQIIIIYFRYYEKYSNSEIILFPGYSRNTHFTIGKKTFRICIQPSCPIQDWNIYLHQSVLLFKDHFFITMAPHNLTAINFTVSIRLSSAVLSSVHQRTNPWPTGLLPLHLEPLGVCMFAFHCVNFMLPLFSVDRLGVM